MLLINGYIGCHSLSPDSVTLKGVEQKYAFDFAKAFAKIFTCGKVLPNVENINLFFKSSLLSTLV